MHLYRLPAEGVARIRVCFLASCSGRKGSRLCVFRLALNSGLNVGCPWFFSFSFLLFFFLFGFQDLQQEGDPPSSYLSKHFYFSCPGLNKQRNRQKNNRTFSTSSCVEGLTKPRGHENKFSGSIHSAIPNLKIWLQ